jgi:hypothetical protein
MHFQTSHISDDQLDNICAGRQLSDAERALWAIFNGTPLGIVITVGLEISKPGAAKEYAEAIYLGKESKLFG